MNSEQLLELARPLLAYLKENHNPHCAIVVTNDCVKVVADEMSVPFDD